MIINVGAWCDYRSRPQSKTELIRLVKDWPEVVFFERTGPDEPVFPNGKDYLYASDLPEHVTLVVRAAFWTATVERAEDGLKVS